MSKTRSNQDNHEYQEHQEHQEQQDQETNKIIKYFKIAKNIENSKITKNIKKVKNALNMDAIQHDMNEDRFKYYLNDDATLEKLKGHATRAPIEQTPTNDQTHTFQFSSGSFVAVMNPLVNFWKSARGKIINPDETDNLDTSVKSVKPQKDAGGKITGHITKLSVEGEDVTITTFDTQVKIRVQGGRMQVEYTTRALLPYLEANIKMNSLKIKEINRYFFNHPGPSSKTNLNEKRVKVHCHFCKKEFKSRKDIRLHMSTAHNTRTLSKLSSIFNSEQQLEPLLEDTSLLNTSTSSNESLTLEEHPLTGPPSPFKPLRGSASPPPPSSTSVPQPSPVKLAPEFLTGLPPPLQLLSSSPVKLALEFVAPPPQDSESGKTPILPEGSFCEEVNTTAPPPPMLWSGRLPVLPASWSMQGGSLPSEFLGAILEAIAKVSSIKETQPQLPFLPTKLHLEAESTVGTSHLQTVVAQQELLSSLAAGNRDLYPPGEKGGSAPLSAGPISGEYVGAFISADTANSASGQDPLASNPCTEGQRTPSCKAPQASLQDPQPEQKEQECLECQAEQVHECLQVQEDVKTSPPEPKSPALTPELEVQRRPSVIKLLSTSPPGPLNSSQAPFQEPAPLPHASGTGCQTQAVVWEGLGPCPPTFLQAPLSHHRQGSKKWDTIEVVLRNTDAKVDTTNNVQVSKKPETTHKTAIPGIGKHRINPVLPSSANIATCNNIDHVQPEEPQSPYGPHECEACEEKFYWAGALFNHMIQEHGLRTPPDSSDSLLYFLAEQNEELNQKLSETQNKLTVMQGQVSEILRSLIPPKCDECKYIAPTTGALIHHIRAKHSSKLLEQQYVETPNVSQPIKSKSTKPKPTKPIQTKPNQNTRPTQPPPPPPRQKLSTPLFPPNLPLLQAPSYASMTAAQAPGHRPPGPQATGRPKGKLQHLHITDSIGQNMLYPVLESSTGSLILPRKATPSVYDERAFKPSQNVQAVLRRELNSGKKFHTVIFGAPSVDITNQDVSRGVLEENTVETMASAHHMVEAAGIALESGQVVQVVLMEHCPRYDTPHNDPFGARPHLARLANQTLRRAVQESGHNERIMVGSQTGLQVDGQARIDLMTNCGNNWRSKNVKTGKFDGVHFYSRKGQEALTSSMMTVLQQAGLVKTKPLPSSLQPAGKGLGKAGQGHQWQTVSRGPRGDAPPPALFQIPLSNRFEGN